MPELPSFTLLADAVLLFHVVIVLFVVGGLLLIVVGNVRSWRWASSLWFRLLHAAAIAVVVAEAWLGFTCPLTTLEAWLRSSAGGSPYTAGFIEHWLQALLFWQAPSWVFTLAYTTFGLAVLAAWWYFPPKRQPKGEPEAQGRG